MDDRYTNFYVEYQLIDTSAVEDSQPVSETNQSFGDLQRLKNDHAFTDYMTLEHNYSVLDGSMPQFPDEAPDDVVYFSSVMSDMNGTFTENPKITISFERTHSSAALTLFFVGDHPLEARVTWTDFSGEMLFSNVFPIDNNEMVISQDVENYFKIEIEFTKTLPERYVKMYFIRYGVIIYWDETNIKSASLVEEQDRLSDKLSVNQLSFEVIDTEANNYNMANSAGIHRYFQFTQKCYAYEQLDDQVIKLGDFYLSKFSENTNLCKMNWTSVIELMDSYTFMGKVYDTGITAGELLNQIFAICGITEYTVDEETSAQMLYGSLQPMSCRNALREVLFACHSIIRTIGGGISILKTTALIRGTLTRNDKISTKTTKQTYYYGIVVKYNEYSLDEVKTQISKGSYSAGTHTLQFSQPARELEIDHGTIDKQDDYYCVFTLEEDSDIILTGRKFQSTSNSVTVFQQNLEAGESQNIKTYTAKLCNNKTAAELGKKILDFTNYRLKFDIKHIAHDSDMDAWRNIENPTQDIHDYIGIYTKRNFDLTGGFIDTATLVGYINDTANWYYSTLGQDTEWLTDTELISSGDETGVII